MEENSINTDGEGVYRILIRRKGIFDEHERDAQGSSGSAYSGMGRCLKRLWTQMPTSAFQAWLKILSPESDCQAWVSNPLFKIVLRVSFHSSHTTSSWKSLSLIIEIKGARYMAL